MESPLVKAALEKLNPPKGFELLKARIVNEPDGSQTMRLLLDYGIGGVKVYEVAISLELLAISREPKPAEPEPELAEAEPEPELAEAEPEPELAEAEPEPELAEAEAPVKKTAPRKAGVGGKK